MGAASVLRLLFYAVRSLTNILSLALLRGSAFLVVALVQAVKLPISGLGLAVETGTELVRTGVNALMQLLVDAAVTLASSAINLVATAASSGADAAGAVAGLIAEKLKDMAAEVPEAIEAVRELLFHVAADLWEHYKGAIGYIIENLFASKNA